MMATKTGSFGSSQANGRSRPKQSLASTSAASGASGAAAAASTVRSGGLLPGGGGGAVRKGGRPPAGGSSAASGGKRSYVKSYCSWRDESIAGGSVISLGSIDENGEIMIPDELIRSIGMDCYTTEEKVQLDNLLQRLQAARRHDERRREKLRRELHRTMAQVSKVQNRGEQPGLLYSLCELCGARLYLIHKRYVCTRCAYLACQSCAYLVRGAAPQCRLCRLEVLNNVKSGEWFLSEARCGSDGEPVFSGPEVLYASLSRERIRLVNEEKARREQKKAEHQARQLQQQQQQQQAAEQLRSDKRSGGKKDKRARESAALLAGEPPASSFASHQYPAINVLSPEFGDGEIRPEDSVSLAGRNYDTTDADVILIEQALQPPTYRESSPGRPLSPPHRASNLQTLDATSRESMMSNVSENEASFSHDLTPTGEVEVNLQYNYKERKFTVNVVQCRNLPHLEGNPPNPYVKTYLLPDKTKRSKRRTQTRRATANPIYSEQLIYNIPKSELETRTLQVSVWHNVTFGANIFLGEVRVPLENYRFEAGAESLSLGRRVELPVPLPTLMYRGDIMLAVRYLSGELIKANQLAKEDPLRRDAKVGRLEIWVQNCRNLAGSGSSASPYVKGYLVNPDSGKSRSRNPHVKQKSAIVKGDVNPNFNSILAFDNVSLADLRSRCLELTVWDYVKIGKNDFLGGVRLNVGDGQYPCMDARGHEVLMWTRMLEKPNAWVEGSLLLRPTMDPLDILPEEEDTEGAAAAAAAEEAS